MGPVFLLIGAVVELSYSLQLSSEHPFKKTLLLLFLLLLQGP